MIRRLSFCLAILSFSQICHADLYSASEALAKGDYDTATREFSRLAEQGDAKAQAHLGYMYYVGEGVPQSYEKAVEWYRRAATQGDKDAQYNLAVAHAFGEGIKQDYKAAALWYRRSAEQGHIISQYSLGISYSFGEGLKQDSKEAVKWFRKAAEQGYARAQIQLGSNYHTGDGVAQDYEQAVHWYRRAADRGDAAAQYNLGTMFRSGKGVKQDYNQALRWFRLAADQSYAAAQNELASIERAIAGAARTKSTPHLQPAPITKPPTPVATGDVVARTDDTQASKPEPVATEQKPLVTVEKSDLLTLHDNASRSAAGTETDTPVDTLPAATDSDASAPLETEASTEKNKKRGFFSSIGRLFKSKKDKETKPIETSIAESNEQDALTTGMPEAIADNEENLAVVEDYSSVQPVVDVKVSELSTSTLVETDDPVQIEKWRDLESDTVITYADTDKKKSGGFFRRLFGKKEKSPDAPSATPSATTAEVADEVAYASTQSDTTVAYATEIAPPTDDPTPLDIPEPATESSIAAQPANEWGQVDPNLDSTDMPATVTPETNISEQPADKSSLVTDKKQKRGFFRRLFGKKKDSPEVTTESEVIAAVEPDKRPMEDAETSEQTAVTYQPDPVKQEAAFSALDKRDYDEAFVLLHELAVKGDASAQYQLGSLYYQGLGIMQDYTEAHNWYRRAAEQGNISAQYSLGNMFLMGEGVAQDDVQAGYWYEKAAEQGHVSARHNLDNIKRVAKNKLEYESEQNVIAADDVQQQHTLSPEDNVTDSEAGKEKPRVGFFKRLFGKKDKRASDNTDGHSSQEQAAETVAVGPDTDVKEPAPATAESIGPTPSQEQAATSPEAKPETKKKGFFKRLFGRKDKPQTAEPVEQTAEEHSNNVDETVTDNSTARSDYERGQSYSFGDGIEKDPGAAFKWFMKAAEQSYAPAQYKVGIAYAYGEGIEKDPYEAAIWYRKAAKQGYAIAQRNLGVMYMNGDGINQDKPLALAWYGILAENGNVMDIRRRDMLEKQLTESELQQAVLLKDKLTIAVNSNKN
ncbi:MAG: hypothetical protein O6928_00505 [Gammaproteobacteria bacterium]|nr:hypothetical protein [Gammaproteobacteria bacterium]